MRFREWVRNLECNRLKREIESANSNSNTWNVWINLRFREWIPQLDITPNDPNYTDASCLLTQSTPQSSHGHASSAPRFLACSVAQLVQLRYFSLSLSDAILCFKDFQVFKSMNCSRFFLLSKSVVVNSWCCLLPAACFTNE